MTIYSKKYPQGYYVYAYIRNKTTPRGPAGSPYYIGKGKCRRAWQPHHTPRDYSYILILEENLTELGAFAIERRLIKWYGRLNIGTGILRNKTDGGEGTSGIKREPGRKHSQETRKKMSEKQKGRGFSDEAKKMMSVSSTGKKHSIETKLKMSQQRLGSKQSDDAKLKKSKALTGLKRTPEQVHNMKKAQSSRIGPRPPHTEESKQKISLSKIGKPRSEELKEKMRKPKERYTCPHCSVTVGGKSNADRWHFDNCKLNPAITCEPAINN